MLRRSFATGQVARLLRQGSGGQGSEIFADKGLNEYTVLFDGHILYMERTVTF